MDASDRVEQWIDDNRDNVISFLQQIIRIPSVTGSEGELQAHMSRYLEDMGLAVDVFEPDPQKLSAHPAYNKAELSYENRPNVVATMKGTGEGRSLLFNAHVDTIPPGAEENAPWGNWTGDIDRGRVFGRGATDAKSGVAAATMALRALRESDVCLKGDVFAEFVVDEETSGLGTLACVERGYTADAGICCAVTDMCIQTGTIGRMWFTIKVRGRTAGIQTREEGISAIDLGYLVCQVVAEYEEERSKKAFHPLYSDIKSAIPCTVGMFESGTYPSAFPDGARLTGSLAILPGEDAEAVKKDFIEFVTERSGEKNNWLRGNAPKIEFKGFQAQPSAIDIDEDIVQMLGKSFEHVIGVRPEVNGMRGSADSRFMIEYGNTPTVIFGPGQTGQMHANDEWVFIEDYISAIKVYAQTIMDWCGVCGE